MRLKAWLTSDIVEQESALPPEPREDHDFKALAILFPADPMIAYEDPGGWYLSATELDAADDEGSGRLRDALDNMVGDINGIHRLLRSGGGADPVRPTYNFEGKVSGTSARLYEVTAYVVSLDGLDEASASGLLRLANDEPDVRLVLNLLGRLERRWFWFDAYRVWDLVRSYWGREEFKRWLEDLGSDVPNADADFQDTANNPNLDGERRHAKRAYGQHSRPDGDPTRSMSRDNATSYLRLLVDSWIHEKFGIEGRAQPRA